MKCCLLIKSSSIRAGLYILTLTGDCRAVLCRRGIAVALTRDHTASLPDERARVELLGGTLLWSHNDWRVGGCGLQVCQLLLNASVLCTKSRSSFHYSHMP
jgi:protein phosphatase 1L